MKRYVYTIIFVTLFIAIVSVIAILFARGYNFTSDQENGILNITSNPDGAIVYLNGEREDKAPTKIELKPGIYELTLEYPDYQEWKKEIEVEASIVTDVQATLFPTDLNLEQLTFSNVDYATFSNDGSIAIYTVADEPNTGIWSLKLETSIFQLSDAKPSKIASIDFLPETCLQSKSYSINVSDDNTRALVKCVNEDRIDFFVLDLRNNNVDPTYINEELGFNPTTVTFSYKQNSCLVKDDAIIGNYNLITQEFTLFSRIHQDFQPLISEFGQDLLLLEYTFDKSERNLFEIPENSARENIDLGEEIDLTTITHMYSSRNNDEFFILTTNEASYIVRHATIPEIRSFATEPLEVLSWAPDGNSFLMKSENTIQTATLKKYPDNSFKVETNDFLLDYSPEKYVLKWASNSQQIIMNNIEQKKIYAIDKEMANQTILYEGALITNSGYKFSNNETFLVLLLNDNTEHSNLYSIKLKV